MPLADANADALLERAIALLEKLVAFESVSHCSNLPVIDFIETRLKENGFSCERAPSPDGAKSNLLARIGPQTGGGVVFSGHTDVVPTEGQSWDTHPFTLTQKDHRLFGRGACDMKGFVAVCLALAPEFAKAKLDKPVYYAFSYDEEIGCLGVPHLLRHMKARGVKPDFALIGEPTNMQVVTAHKGVLSFETTVHGLEWHSSQPHLGVNALQVGCDLVHFLTQMGKELASIGKKDTRFDPPYTTVHTGIMRSGTARNIIPRECFINWEIRPLPGEDSEALMKRFHDFCAEQVNQMRAVYPQADIVTRQISRMLAVSLPANTDIHAQRVMHAAKTNAQHAVSFGTEAGVFNEYGIPAIVCGPGSIEQAHKPNEFVEISQLRACVEFMLRLC